MKFKPRGLYLLARVVGPETTIYLPETEALQNALFEVLEVGPFVSDLKPGDRIISNLRDGDFVTTVDSDTGPLYLIPEERALCLVTE